MRRVILAGLLIALASAVIAGVLIVHRSDSAVSLQPGPLAATGDLPGVASRTAGRRTVARAVAASQVALPPGFTHTIQSALEREAVDVLAKDGTLQMGVWLPGASEPLLVGQDVQTPMRLWSLSKPLVAITLLTDDAEAGRSDADLGVYLQRSLERSDNCAQRYLTLRLQDATGGIQAAAVALRETLERDGADLDISHAQTDTLGSACISSTYAGLPASYVPRRALLVGTATWTIADAVGFARSLTGSTASRSTPAAIATATVLKLMRHDKEPAIEPGAGTLTAPLDWGAGEAFAAPCWRVAWKAGWGGAAAHIPWLGSQLGVVTLRGGQRLAFAVAVHPYAQPADDDPGLTTAPAGITAMLTALRGALASEDQSCS